MYIFTKQNPLVAALTATFATALVGAMLYLVFEPTAMFAADDTNSFTVSQEIGAEIAFTTTSGNIAMNGTAIGGETGGIRTGSTTVGITTNDASGYTLAIKFEDATGMVNPVSADEIIYYATTTPDYNMGLGAASSAFAYSVSSTNAVSAFLNNGSACGAGSSSADNCYAMHGAPTTDETIVDSNATASNELTVVGFQVIVGNSSGLENGFYYATTTLTATSKS
jgi:hypothetical protein